MSYGKRSILICIICKCQSKPALTEMSFLQGDRRNLYRTFWFWLENFFPDSPASGGYYKNPREPNGVTERIFQIPERMSGIWPKILETKSIFFFKFFLLLVQIKRLPMYLSATLFLLSVFIILLKSCTAFFARVRLLDFWHYDLDLSHCLSFGFWITIKMLDGICKVTNFKQSIIVYEN